MSDSRRANTKYNGNGYESIPFIEDPQHDGSQRRNSESETSECSENTEISLPFDAPIVEQRRCSIDIDTIAGNTISRKNGVMHPNNYLETATAELKDSIQDIT